MNINTIFIDFDSIYELKRPGQDTIVLTNIYRNEWTINVLDKVTNKLDPEFIKYCQEIKKGIKKDIFNIDINEIYLYNALFHQLSLWIQEIELAINKHEIESDCRIIFSSYSNNHKIFIFEAEGEVNRQFLYKRSYYLSWYIKKYFESKGYRNFFIQKRRTIESYFMFYLRGFIVLNLKLIQLLFYKICQYKRDYSLKHSETKNTAIKPILVSTRNIIQTQYIKNLYNIFKDNIIVIVNESSSTPFRNLKESKKTFDSFFYAEGYLKLNQLFKEYIFVLKSYMRRSISYNFYFHGIQIDLSSFYPELSIKHFHLKTYALSVSNSLKKINAETGTDRIISFEILPPFSYYLKEYLKKTVFQVQTTLLSLNEFPNFVYGDKLFFMDQKSYDDHFRINPQNKNKYSVLNNIKYIGLNRKNEIKVIKNITYFTQPIFKEEEEKIIELLRDFCLKNNLLLQIKLHPRATIPNVDLTGIKIIEGTKSSADIIFLSDIIVTRNSSIGMDAWMLNVPVIFFVNGLLKGENIPYIPIDYKGSINTKISTEELARILQDVMNSFYTHPFHENFDIKIYDIENKLFK